MEAQLFELLDQIATTQEMAGKKKIERLYESLTPTLTDEQRILVREIEDTWAGIVAAVQLATARKIGAAIAEVALSFAVRESEQKIEYIAA